MWPTADPQCYRQNKTTPSPGATCCPSDGAGMPKACLATGVARHPVGESVTHGARSFQKPHLVRSQTEMSYLSEAVSHEAVVREGPDKSRPCLGIAVALSSALTACVLCPTKGTGYLCSVQVASRDVENPRSQQPRVQSTTTCSHFCARRLLRGMASIPGCHCNVSGR